MAKTKKQWDCGALSRGLKRDTEGANLYADEHADRVRHGQPNGREKTRDEYRGATELYNYLSTSVATDNPAALSRELDRLAKDDAEKYFDGDRAVS
ncbi:hypothetical protein [Rhizobium leguminosarum]|uniref:hypothetical protein n=1 Tax=Rhizobium leguminosarum TaxID=384 RepID=UPI001039E956|nr:hypothetical protein [Rhizobium leguminosarum]MBY5461838.1 hypothetical protein [Rhizobium leguminosarum]TCA42875.1 hypothetical protein E0H72_15705 [Rhizobium leguminosarum bv. viciae]